MILTIRLQRLHLFEVGYDREIGIDRPVICFSSFSRRLRYPKPRIPRVGLDVNRLRRIYLS
jgi:hypothetical protein